jgi:small subunit ribosomal protein S16
MATRIRLRRVGRKKQPSYRIVVTDKQKARDGRFVELLGHYDPRTEPATLEVDQEKARAWLAKGATPSDTVRSLLKKAGVFEVSTEASTEAPAEAQAAAPEQAPPETPAASTVEAPDQNTTDASTES